LIGFYNYTVWLTFIGMLSASTGMALAITGHITGAVICLMFSGFCDMFDGMVARTKKDRTEDEKNFGIQLDSLSDIVCFGMLPLVIGINIGADKWWQCAILALFALAGLIRLAYFNVKEASRQKMTSEKLKVYDGVPITSSALTVPLLFCFEKLIGEGFPTAYTFLLLVNGALFITPIKVPKAGKRELIIMLALGVIFTVVIVAVRGIK